MQLGREMCWLVSVLTARAESCSAGLLWKLLSLVIVWLQFMFVEVLVMHGPWNFMCVYSNMIWFSCAFLIHICLTSFGSNTIRFNTDRASKNKNLLDGYLEVYEELCNANKVSNALSIFHFLFIHWDIHVAHRD